MQPADRFQRSTPAGVAAGITVPVILERLGSRLFPADRVPSHPFATGRLYGSCPRCGRWDAIHVAGSSWWAACSCWGRPWTRHDALTLLSLARGDLP